ncbi:hypothetical protein [Streptomyces sp. NBC_01006]|uniref:hypothetical protein n=1 Tax=Streptomyces sp. NBC_01006 TaxID=2903716 RepID=UPI0038680887|nr:hypothetical protein OG509_17585 [Streptomyces sp. NBC_01006]
MTEQQTSTEAAPEARTPEAAEPRTAMAPGPQAPVAPRAADPEVPAAPKDRRKLYTALRWTAAVVAFAGFGAGTAYAIARPERTDIPGLSTKDDGRWEYPALAKPTPPPGAPLPFAKDNADGIHYAGLTEFLLPAPKGSSPDSALKLEKDSVVSPDTFLEEYDPAAREKLKQGFTDNGLRQIVARGWTTPDGVRTRIYLLRFHSSGFADAFKGCAADMNLNGVKRFEVDSSWAKAKTGKAQPDLRRVSVRKESTPFGDEQTKAGCIQSGDVQAVILQVRKGEVPTVPLHQTVILQNQLLG